MKIICDSQEEYDDLMEASKYLHDFGFCGKDKRSLWRIVKKTGGSLDQSVGNGKVGFLCHIYLSGRDFPNKDEVIQVKGDEC